MKNKMNGKSKLILGLLSLIVVAIAVIIVVAPKEKTYNSKSLTTYTRNIALMKEAGFEYFQSGNLPAKVGTSNVISLNEMVDNKLVIGFQDEKGNVCNGEDSYVKVTKTIKGDYEMKVALTCDSKSDYIVTSIGDKTVRGKVEDYNNSLALLPVQTKENDVKMGDAPVNVPANVSSGVLNNTKYVSSGGNTGSATTASNVTYITNYNITYVNNCMTQCVTTDCTNSCLTNIYYTVNFEPQGGSYVAKQVVKQGDTAKYATTYKPGYTFVGWYLDGVKYDFNTPVTRQITLVARWEEIVTPTPDNKYVVNFETNGGGYIASQTIVEGNQASRPTDPTRNCYTFAGWFADKELTQRYDFNTPVTKDMTLYAKWVDDGSCKNKYDINFDSDGGTPVPPQTVVEDDKVKEPTDPVKQCFSFAGWYTDKALTQKYNFNTPVNKNMTLYAKWVDDGSCRNKYQVEFDSKGGNTISSQTVEEGNTATRPTNPTKAGYVFKGWYYNGREFDFNTKIYQDYKLVAEWAEISYTVTFNSNGGNNVGNQTVVEGKTAYEPNDPVRNGYVFKGWYYNGKKFDFSTKIYQDYTLDAEWEREEQNYTVSFNSNGGTSFRSQTVVEGNRASNPGTPVRNGYVFKGWYYNGREFDFNTKIYQDYTLVAEWEREALDYTVSFNSNGGTSYRSQTVAEGNRAYNPGTPTRSGYVFRGWYYNGREFDFTTRIYQNYTLVAEWERENQNYTVSFDSNGGTSYRSQSVEEGNRAYNPGTPTRNGYIFKGWYYNGREFDFTTRIYQNYTLVAEWERAQEQYNTYCKVVDRRYYSTSYVSASKTTWNYNWKIKFENLRNVQDLRILNKGYVTTTSMYEQLYSDYVNGRGISTPSTSSSYNIPLPSVAMLINTSLKSNNFSFTLSNAYYSGGYWYADASVRISNYNGVTPYNSTKGSVHPVPFYFDVNYTDMSNCVDDLASNSYRYSGYKVTKTYTR